MSVADVISAVQSIQNQIAQFTQAAGSSSPATAQTFATALAGAGSTDGTAATSSASTGTATTGTSGTVTGQDVVDDAMKYIGVPYVFGGESTSGMDCSGLVQKVFSDLGISVPRLVHEQATVGTAVDSLKDAKPGDIITLNNNDHVVIYAGNNTVIHAPYAGRTVCTEKIWFDQSDITSIRRIVPDSSSSSTSASTASVSSGSDLSSILSSLGLLNGTSSTSTTAQLLAARAALYGTSTS